MIPPSSATRKILDGLFHIFLSIIDNINNKQIGNIPGPDDTLGIDLILWRNFGTMSSGTDSGFQKTLLQLFST